MPLLIFPSGFGVAGPAVIPDPELTDCGTDLLETGMSWLTDQLQAFHSKSVIYQRGDYKTALCATLGRTRLELDDGLGGTVLQYTDKDFLIPVSKLKVNGVLTLPERGDRVREPKDGAIYVYEVLIPGSNEQPWRYSDPYRKMLRIHTKLMNVET